MDGIDFKRAKNFWQNRAASAEQQSGSPPKLEVTSVVGEAETISAKSIHMNDTASVVPPVEPCSPIEPPPSLPPPPPSPPTSTSESTSASSVPVAASAAKLAMNNMFKTFQESKFFTNSAPNSENSNTSSSEATTPLTAVQLPDMTVWKEKMMKYSAKSSISFDKLSTQLMTSLSNVALPSSLDAMTSSSDQETSTQLSGEVKTNLQYPQGHNTSDSSTNMEPNATYSQYGELIVCEVLAAKDLAVGDFFQGESDPYIDIQFRGWKRTTNVIKGTKQPVFNERFVFWIPCDASTSKEYVSITVINRNLVIPDETLGEVQIALAIPMDESFDEWYPLMNKDGKQQGHVRIGLRRMQLTSTALQQAGQTLAQQERALNDEDLVAHGETIPTLWYGFAQAVEPVDVPKVSQTDVLAAKLNDLSRRFMGIELATSEVTADGKRRDIF